MLKIIRFELWGNIKDGLDCNMVYLLNTLEEGASDKKMLSHFHGFALPLTESGARTHHCSSKCLSLSWSDESYADVVCERSGAIIGCVEIEGGAQ